jgi:hypothetical protein
VKYPHVVGAFVALLLPGSQLRSQVIQPDVSSGVTSRLSFGLTGKWIEPVEHFARNVGWGVGGGLSVGYHLAGFEELGFRTELTHHWYGWESKRVQLSPTANRVFVDMSTTNNVFVWTIGPELAIRRGPVQPYVLWQAGFSNFYTKSSVKDETNGTAFAESTHLFDYGWATEYGGGMRIVMSAKPGKGRVSLDIGGRMTLNGTRDYLRSGDIVDLPDGSLQFNVRRTPANFLQYTAGLFISGL